MSSTKNQMSAILVNAVNTAYANMAKNKDLWADSPWKHINDLENDFVGRLGEQFIQNLCDTSGIEASIDGLKSNTRKRLGNGLPTFLLSLVPGGKEVEHSSLTQA